MKLLTYYTGTGPRCGVLQDDCAVDVTALLEPCGMSARCLSLETRQ